ncbi:MAG: PHP domain-containing protein [Acidobacteria bacterium]|nr:PHP domain-containing protein [Acidobacteriota bacterium]MBS1865715.1 PHP domain-containing protein [Acidobacteriota bacterium]
MCNTPFIRHFCRESYNDAQDVYNRCKQLGMSIVTVTDHDCIDAAEAFRSYPDFFLSEEVTCTMPTGTELHLGVYAITERDHLEIQKRRTDFVSLLMYLTERKLFFSVNHVFSGLTGRREFEDFEWFISYAAAFETRNGQMWSHANFAAEEFAKSYGKIEIAGSDSHTLAGVALTYTEVPGARTVEEFFAGLRARQSRIHGHHGSLAKITTDVFRVTGAMLREKPWTLSLLPLAVLLPAITAGHWMNEIRFCEKWTKRINSSESAPRRLWELDATLHQV